jgi:hypothetical protein
LSPRKYGKAWRDFYREGPRKPTRTPMEQSLELLRALGWQTWIVESNLSFPGADGVPVPIKRDLFGLFDIIAVKPNHAPLLVQTTSLTHKSDHLAKLRGDAWLDLLRACGHFEMQLHLWQTVRPYGYKVIDINERDDAGNYVYTVQWNSVLLKGARSKKRPRLQESLWL